MSPLFAFMFGLGPAEIAVCAVLGVLLFGKRLPDVGRYLGKTLTEFKKGVKGLEEDLDAPRHVAVEPTRESAGSQPIRAPQRVAATAPKFEEPSANADVGV